MLQTPMGDVVLTIDGRTEAFTAKPVPNDEWCPDLAGRYLIKVLFQPDGGRHSIRLAVHGHRAGPLDFAEPGERQECLSFCEGSCKLSIGAQGESGQPSLYDYENAYFDDGLSYEVFPETKTAVYYFSVAWIGNVSNENETQTWYGADVYYIVREYADVL